MTAGGKPVAGKVTWAEDDTVLLFTPSGGAPRTAPKVAMTVGARRDVPVGRGPRCRRPHGTFTVKAEARGAEADAQAAAEAKTGGGPDDVDPALRVVRRGVGQLDAVETYYLRLMNCTRTGGWVTSSGTCSSPGGPERRAAHPQRRHQRQGHAALREVPRDPRAVQPLLRRERRATGFAAPATPATGGARTSAARREPVPGGVLGDHLFFQAEKPYNGGHYVNLMNAPYSEAGIGVWVSCGRVRLVIDFYHP